MIDPVGAKPVPSKDILAPTIFSYLPSPLLKLNNIDKWLKFRRNNEFPIEICSIMQLYYFRFREIWDTDGNTTNKRYINFRSSRNQDIGRPLLELTISNFELSSNQPQGVLFFCLCFFVKTIRLVKKFVKILSLFFKTNLKFVSFFIIQFAH